MGIFFGNVVGYEYVLFCFFDCELFDDVVIEFFKMGECDIEFFYGIIWLFYVEVLLDGQVIVLRDLNGFGFEIIFILYE